jgi:bis(5'-nucleosyl)-tetraphosphatase (symmetrical)
MMHAGGGYAMVHAGLLPQWSVTQALDLAREVETVLRSPDHREFLKAMYGNEPVRWRDDLAGHDRLRIIVNAMTRMRLAAADGTLELNYKLGLDQAPAGYFPWYDVPGRASRGTPILFGHWAALGLLMREDVVCLDSGCVWGRALTALRLEDRRLFQLDCAELAGTASED